MKKICKPFGTNILLIILLIAAEIIFLNVNLFSQPTLEWVRRFNSSGTNNDGVSGMAMDSTGNIIVTGGIQTTNQGNNYCTIKYNSTGVQQWVVIYNGPTGSNSIDVATDVAVDQQGNVYVTGYSERGALYSDDFCTIKYNSQGVQQWVRRYNYNGSGQNDPCEIAIDNQGNIYVTGESKASGTGYDIVTIKYSPVGDSLWVRRYSNPGALSFRKTSVAVDNSGNIYTGCSSTINNWFTAIKYSTTGVQQWVAISNNAGVFTRIKTDNQNNVYVTGSGGTGGNGNYITIKYNTSGVQQWLQAYNGTGNSEDNVYDIGIDKNGNVYVTGSSAGSGTSYDYATVKYNSSGVQQWVQRYNSTSNDYDVAESLCLDDSSDVYVSGWSFAGSTTTIKYSSSGVQRWIKSGNGGGYTILLDRFKNIYVTGTIYESQTGSDYYTSKYVQYVGVEPITNSLPNKYELFQNYPNPFNPATKIKFSVGPPLNPLLRKEGTIVLKIYDVLGKEVAVFTPPLGRGGEGLVEWNASDYASGVYFYSLISDGVVIDTKKMLLIK